MIATRVRVAILLAIVGSYFVGTGVASSEAIDAISVVLLVLLLVGCEAVASPRSKPTPPKPKADPDAAWREAADER